MSKLQNSYLIDNYGGHEKYLLKKQKIQQINFMDYKTLLKMKH
jgi:hypothetical protein